MGLESSEWRRSEGVWCAASYRVEGHDAVGGCAFGAGVGDVSKRRTSGKVPLEKTLRGGQYARGNAACGERSTHMSRQVFPQAPSPTMTSLRRISAICAMEQRALGLAEDVCGGGVGVENGRAESCSGRSCGRRWVMFRETSTSTG